MTSPRHRLRPVFNACDLPWRGSKTYCSGTGNDPTIRSTTDRVSSVELLSTMTTSQARTEVMAASETSVCLSSSSRSYVQISTEALSGRGAGIGRPCAKLVRAPSRVEIPANSRLEFRSCAGRKGGGREEGNELPFGSVLCLLHLSAMPRPFAVAILIASVTLGLVARQPAAAQRATTPQRDRLFRVMTWNVHMGVNARGRYDLPRIAESI